MFNILIDRACLITDTYVEPSVSPSPIPSPSPICFNYKAENSPNIQGNVFVDPNALRISDEILLSPPDGNPDSEQVCIDLFRLCYNPT